VQGLGSIVLRGGGNAKITSTTAVGSTAAQGARQPDTPGIASSRAVADALYKILMQTPDGKLSGAALCSQLYKECENAKALIATHKGIKNFVSKFAAQVEFVPDQVLQSFTQL
jgi:hypothetical protein